MTSTGLLITLEGADGCGKTTQSALLARALTEAGREVVALREPGGTAISERIRALVLDPANTEMSDECELLLYEASRAQLVMQVIRPALDRGAVVLCDRYFDSTTAYQAAGRGLDADVVSRANALGSCGVVPHRTIVLDLDPVQAFARACEDGADRMESAGLELQKRVREGFLALGERESARVRVVPAAGEPREVHARVCAELIDLVDGIVPASEEATS